jgi:hypothetical protein
MARYKMKTPFSTKSMPLWKRIAFYLISLGALGAMITFFPSGYRPVALMVGITLFIIGLIAAIYADRSNDWRAVVLFSSIFPSLFFTLGARALISQLSHAWIWISLLLSCYLLAWLIPMITPRLSAFLWREQTSPKTRLGMGCMGIFTRFSATIMALGPLTGMYLSRYGYGDVALLIFGIGMCLVAIVFGQIYSHQLWKRRPWSQQEATEREGL